MEQGARYAPRFTSNSVDSIESVYGRQHEYDIQMPTCQTSILKFNCVGEGATVPCRPKEQEHVELLNRCS
jgi:hypothetical protein